MLCCFGPIGSIWDEYEGTKCDAFELVCCFELIFLNHLPLIFLIRNNLGSREIFLAVLHKVSIFITGFAFER
jgi:hypothetical protein